MENVLFDRSSGSLEFPKTRSLGRSRRGLGARPAAPGGAYSSFPMLQPYNHLHNGGAWTSAPALPYARPPIYSSPSLPLLPSNQPPLLPLPPAATKYATFPCLPAAPPPPPPAPRAGRSAAVTTTVPAAAAAPAPARRERDRRRRPARPPPPSTAEAPRAQKKEAVGAGDASAARAGGERGAGRPRAGGGQELRPGTAARARAATQQPADAQVLPRHESVPCHGLQGGGGAGRAVLQRGGRHRRRHPRPPPPVGEKQGFSAAFGIL